MRGPLVCATALLVTASLMTATAAADRGLPRRYSADAFFSSTSGCVETFVGVFPVAFKDRQSGQVVGASMNMQLEQFDTCTNTQLLQASPGIVALSDNEFEMSEGLNKARLHVAVTVRDAVSGQDFPIAIDLRYQRVGPRSDCSEQVSSDEATTFCSAVAEGTISDGTTNFTPAPLGAVFQEHRPL